MKIWIAVIVVTFAVGTAACRCDTLKWATCDGDPCKCTIQLDDGIDNKQTLDCTKLISKCYLMKLEMYRARKNLSTRGVGGKPVETAIVDNDGIYDPDCENDGKFKARQCNNTEECWCVNSAGVRRTDKGDKNLKCEKLVETYWVHLELKHKEVKNAVDATKLKDAIKTAIHDRYNFDKALVEEVKYDPEARMIVVDVKKAMKDRTIDLTGMAYYMEKDVKVLPLFKDQAKFEPSVDGQKLEMVEILVYYVDEEAPTFTMKRLTGGVIAVIVVVILAVAAGLLVLFFARRREQKYSKAEPREMEAM